MVGWHHQLNGHGFGQTLGVGDGQGGLECCGSWGRKELDTTERMNGTELNFPLSELKKEMKKEGAFFLSVNVCQNKVYVQLNNLKSDLANPIKLLSWSCRLAHCQSSYVDKKTPSANLLFLSKSLVENIHDPMVSSQPNTDNATEQKGSA